MNQGVWLWDREIPSAVSRNPTRIRGGFPAVYVWYFNQHSIDSVLYVGQSADVRERIYDEYRAPSGFISQWLDAKMLEVPIYCDKYSDPIIDGPILKKGRCDCLPRLKVEIIPCRAIELDDLEISLIGKFNPPLNKRYAQNGNANQPSA
jgi:hypothetical protein